MKKIENTCIEKYGVKNIGLSEEHIKNMKRTNGKKCNPFATKDFSILEYIKGKRVLDENKKDFLEYRFLVLKYTNKSKKKLSPPKECFYTNLNINNNKEYDYNMFTYATIDHKTSIIKGFENNIPPEVIGGIDNICWCAKFINSIKREKTEEEFLNSMEYKRFLVVKDKIQELINESKIS